MAPVTATADSLIGSLCREVDGLRQRSAQTLLAMRHCQDHRLLERLQRQVLQQENRRQAIRAAARSYQRQGLGDGLAIALLIELTSRPLRA